MGRIHEVLFFGGHAALRTGTNGAWRALLASERMPRDALLRARDREVAATWEILRSRAPFFADRLPAGPLLDASTGRIRPDVWRQAPIVSRDDLHTRLADLAAFPSPEARRAYADAKALPRGWIVQRSGGSTGQPVECLQDGTWRAWNRAAALWCDKLSGAWPCREKRLKVWGSPTEIRAARTTLAGRLSSWLQQGEILPSFRLDETAMRSHLAEIDRRVDVPTIEGYSSALFTLAQFALAEGIRPRPVRRVISSAGTLTPDMRDAIEAALGAPVFNRYGSRDGGATANQCERREGLHVCEPTIFLEVVDAAGEPVPDGVEGEILVTQIRNRAMPLFRYRIGDAGVLDPEPCPCGRPHRILKALTGRMTERLRTPDGRVLDHTYFLHLIGVVLNTGWLDRFRVVQHAPGSVEVLVAPRPGAEEGAVGRGIAAIESEVGSALGRAVALHVRRVAEIPPSPSGKHLYVVAIHDPGLRREDAC
jgi:phenylacetate-CoA ligase